MPSFTAFPPPPLTSVSSSVDPFLFLPLFLFKVQKHRPCSIFKFGLESCPSSDRANTGSMHSSSAYLSKYSLVSGSMKSAPICSFCRSVSCRFLYLYCICISLHVLSLYPYFSCPLFFFLLVPSFLISGCLTFSLAVVSFHHLHLISLLWPCAYVTVISPPLRCAGNILPSHLLYASLAHHLPVSVRGAAPHVAASQPADLQP